jgi:AcrR family transcriptional regulator
MKRHYDSSRRKAQARATRRQIAEAARELFFEHGYAGATIEAIAAKANVAKETVYATFKNKRNILAFLLDISLGGDDQPVRIIDRPGPQAVMHDTDQHRQLLSFSQGITEIMSRAAPIFEVIRIAAKTEPEISQRMTHLYKERMENMKTFVHHVAANGPLRDGLDERDAAEIVWAITSPELYILLTDYRSWSQEQYSQWLVKILTRLLLA